MRHLLKLFQTAARAVHHLENLLAEISIFSGGGTDPVELDCLERYSQNSRHTIRCIQRATKPGMQHERRVKSKVCHHPVETLSHLMLLHQ
jgi:hypothetical protein